MIVAVVTETNVAVVVVVTVAVVVNVVVGRSVPTGATMPVGSSIGNVSVGVAVLVGPTMGARVEEGMGSAPVGVMRVGATGTDDDCDGSEVPTGATADPTGSVIADSTGASSDPTGSNIPDT